MSQSATLYRISKTVFEQLEKSDNNQQIDFSKISKSYSTFQSSFMGIEFILSKGQAPSAIELISKIFNPKQYLNVPNFENFTHEEQMEFYANGGFIHFLDTTTVSTIHKFLEDVSQSYIHEKYNSKELNDNGIYPEVWHNDDSPDQVLNERHILEDTLELKNIFKQADRDQDYILVFVG